MNQSPLLDASAALSTVMDFSTGRLAVCTSVDKMNVSDMADYFADEDARAKMAEEEDATVYEVHKTEPDGDGPHANLCYASTTIYPGTIGNEYFMTRGHAHPDPEGTEIYLTLGGQGMMLLQTRDRHVQALSMTQGTILYIPGTAFHRVVNIGDEPLVLFTVYPVMNAHAHDIAYKHTFRRIIVVSEDGPDLAVNAQYRESGEEAG